MAESFYITLICVTSVDAALINKKWKTHFERR